jgi:hypothetical protein
MTRKETGAADVTLDLMAIQSNALEAIRDYGHYLRDAESAGMPEVAYVGQLMEEDSARAAASAWRIMIILRFLRRINRASPKVT